MGSGMSVLVCGLGNNHGLSRTGFANARHNSEWRKRKRRWVVSLAQYPFAEKGATEAVFPVVVVDYVLSFKFGDGLFDGCGVEDLCRFEEGAGEYLPAAADGYGAENARLLRGKGCYAKRRYAKRYYTIWHNKEDVSDFAERKRGMSVLVCGLNNHGLSQTGFANARRGLGFAERKRGMSVFVCGLNKTI